MQPSGGPGVDRRPLPPRSRPIGTRAGQNTPLRPPAPRAPLRLRCRLPRTLPPCKQDRRTLFNQWKALHDKSYATAPQENAAFANFNQALTDMISHNQNKGNKFWKGEAGRLGCPGCGARAQQRLCGAPADQAAAPPHPPLRSIPMPPSRRRR